MLVHIWRLPKIAQIQDQLSHPIKVGLFRFRTLADCITSIGVLHESGIPLNNYIATATRNVRIEFLVGTGACRADAGVVLHQRARSNSFECISQSDTSFVEVDVYCLDTSTL